MEHSNKGNIELRVQENQTDGKNHNRASNSSKQATISGQTDGAGEYRVGSSINQESMGEHSILTKMQIVIKV